MDELPPISFDYLVRAFTSVEYSLAGKWLSIAPVPRANLRMLTVIKAPHDRSGRPLRRRIRAHTLSMNDFRGVSAELVASPSER